MGYVLLLPVIGIFGSLLITDARRAGQLNMLLSALELWLILTLAGKVAGVGEVYYFGQLIYLDGLSVLQLLLIGSISLMGAIYSVRYIVDGVQAGTVNLFQVRFYYVLFHAFVLSMILMAALNNMGLMWVALEATTLSTAFFIGFTRTKASLEAAWKYIIICTLGIGLGLLGISLFLYGAVHEKVELDFTMANWTVLLEHAGGINEKLAAVAFAIILVGFGTKVGFAPMHSWLPDAYSESPSPISAMMSGILGSLAFYGVLRFYILTAETVDRALLNGLLIAFGVTSLVVAGASILRQKNYKRMLAFSSIENMGIIALGMGFGGSGVFFALFHTIIQALSKALLFLVAGNILKVFKTREIDKVRSMFHLMPVNSFFLLIGMLAVIGMPPFASFISEFGIVRAGIVAGYWGAVALLAVVLLVVFAGFVVHFSRMLFYNAESAENAELAHLLHSLTEDSEAAVVTEMPNAAVVGTEFPDDVAVLKQQIQTQATVTRIESIHRGNLLAPALLTAAIIGLSIYVPDVLKTILEQAAAIIG